MSKCTTCGTNFVSAPESPTPDQECKYCQIRRLTEENAELRAKLVIRAGQSIIQERDDLLDRMKVARDHYDALLERVKRLREALLPFGCETCNGTGVFTFECQGCITGEGECTCANEKPSPCPQCQVIPEIKAMYDARKQALAETEGAK